MFFWSKANFRKFRNLRELRNKRHVNEAECIRGVFLAANYPNCQFKCISFKAQNIFGFMIKGEKKDA